MRTLLTGFGAFATVLHNPAERLLAHFAAQGAAGHELTTRLLPVSFARAEAEVRALLTAQTFENVVLLGVARKATTLRLEQQAQNRDHALIPDADGNQPTDTLIRPDAPAIYPVRLPLRDLCAQMAAAGYPVVVSEDAGAYVCNHTYYAALDTLAAGGRETRCLFVHLPPDEITCAEPPEGFVPFAVQKEAMQFLLDCLKNSLAPLSVV